MPLSENEQRMLEQMERALYAEDPKFATQLRGSDARTFYRKRLVVAALGFSLGVVALMAGAIANIPAVAVLGFLLMLGSAWLGISSWRRIPAPGEIGSFPSGGASPKGRSKKSGGGFMNRVEDRWKRRRDEMGR